MDGVNYQFGPGSTGYFGCFAEKHRGRGSRELRRAETWDRLLTQSTDPVLLALWYLFALVRTRTDGS